MSVLTFSGLLVEFCAADYVDAISKGVRAGDFAYELQMAQMVLLRTRVETILLPADPQWSFVSSSLVREVATLGGDVSGVPAARCRPTDGSAGQCPAAERVGARCRQSRYIRADAWSFRWLTGRRPRRSLRCCAS